MSARERAGWMVVYAAVAALNAARLEGYHFVVDVSASWAAAMIVLSGAAFLWHLGQYVIVRVTEARR